MPSTKIRYKTRMSSHTTTFDIIPEVLANTIMQEKEMKGITIRKEDIKLSLFTDNISIYVENLKNSWS